MERSAFGIGPGVADIILRLSAVISTVKARAYEARYNLPIV